ncbi:type II secretion system F family protein [Pseudoprimorskyibacter insulae]|nr:type II secretion system F family protein [Pseudoprimorskyibacter insulae]
MLDVLIFALNDMLGPNGFAIAAGGIVLLLTVLFLVPMAASGRRDPLNKLRAEVEKANLASGGRKATLREKKSSSEKLNKYAQFLEPQDEAELGEMRKKLLAAGYTSRDAVRYFYLAQFGGAVAGLVLGLAYFFLILSPEETTTKQLLMYILGPLVVGYMAPKYWLNKRSEQRKAEIESGFPDALDMMLVCVEAGQSMDQSIVRVAGELEAAYPALAQEFAIVSHEMKAGKDKTTVLNDMAGRCDVQDISSFVTVLNQSQTFGTPISDALRVYASEMRDKRVMRAEEKANKLPTKMTLTTMMLTVPPLLIILVGPSAVGITRMNDLGSEVGVEE